jgi:broad specificity phosphatase PhoE
MHRHRYVFPGIFCLALAVPGASLAETSSPAALIEALRDGGHVVFLRHTGTEHDYADQIDAVMGDCSTQRVLSEAGWHDAKTIGAAFARHRIPVAQVVSSEYCRAWQTADLAFGRYVKSRDLNFAPAETYDDAQWAAMREALRPHLAAVPPAGFNVVLVGHDDPFEAATGLYPEPMGVAVVVAPDGAGGFTLLGSLAPDDWAR